MSEHHEPLIVDISQLDELEAAKAARSAESLMWPVAEIPSGDPELTRSENYLKAKATIDEGIATSIAAKLPRYMVKVWQKKTYLHDAKEIDITLSQYLGGSSISGIVSAKEYLDLLTEYNPINQAYLDLHKDEIALIEAAEPSIETTEQKIGRVATKTHKPIQTFEFGGKEYIDIQSVRAGDYIEKDDNE
ncbi:MAG TPA: hypothetical protein VIM31_04700 [Candidatus Microsaccharimonas sp.]|jgi:hypothetical protein